MTPPDRTFATTEELLAHAGWVRALARALVGDASTADDLVQDAWVAALKRPPRAGSSIRPWLSRVVRNLAANRRRGEVRRGAREIEREIARGEPASQSGSDEVAIELETHRLLIDAIRSLDEPLRSSIVEHYFRGKTSVEMARAQGIAESTVRWRLKQAVDALRERLDDRHRGDRRAWMILVAPLATHSKDAAAITTSAAAGAAAGTLIAMNTLAKIGIVAALVIAGIGIWRFTRPDPLAPLDREVRGDRAPTDLEREGSAVKAPVGNDERVALPTETAEKPAPIVAAASELEAIIEATLVDTRGLPIAGATLVCVDRVEMKEIQREEAPQATSDAQGRVRLALRRSDASSHRGHDAGMPADEWVAILGAEARGHASQRVNSRVGLGKTASLGNIVLPDGGDVLGRVVDAAGVGVGGSQVLLMLADVTLEEHERKSRFVSSGKRQKSFAFSSSDGMFEMRAVPCGVYRVWAQKEGMLAGFTEPFDLRLGDELRLPDLALAPNARAIRGIVVHEDGTPCLRPTIESTCLSAAYWVEDDCHADGTFVIEDCVADKIDLYAHADEPDTGDFILHDVPVGTSNVVMRLGKPHWIDVLAQDEQGAPIPDFVLDVRDLHGSGSGGYSKKRPDGHDRFKALAKTFRLTVSAPGFEAQTFGPLEAATTPSEMTVKMKRVPRITGHVTADGKPVQSQWIELVRVAEGAEPRRRNGFPERFDLTSQMDTATDLDGAFAFECHTSGRFVVTTRGPGYAPFLSKEFDWPQGGLDLDVVLTSGGTLEGRLLTGAGDTAAGSWVTASIGLGDLSARVDADGMYTIDHLTPGKWWVRRTSRDMRNVSLVDDLALRDPTLAEVEILEGQTTRFDVDARNAAPVVLVGHIAIAGVDPRTWTAHVVPTGGKDQDSLATTIDGDGSFRMAVADVGPVVLSLSDAGMQDRDARIEVALDLVSGENRWSLDVPTGELDVDGAALGRGLIAHVRHLANGATFTTRFRSKDGAPLALGLVPAGPARIVDAKSGTVLAEVDVPARGVAHATLP